ncbi:MAG TPA: DUF899 family protein [Caulobacteraceae bacterium]|nr:DUF899 family protein [Caulobacteraceae bacterium]
MTGLPPIVDREAWEARLRALRSREKAHTREGDAIAAARRRLPMVEVDPTTPLVGAAGEVPLIAAFEGRSQLFASFHMWHAGRPAERQCEGCTFFTGHALELSYLHSRDVTFAVFCEGPYDASARYRDFMGWDMPWYAVPGASSARLVADRHFGMKVCYLRDSDRVFETYWTTDRGCEPMTGSYGMLDMMVYGRQEAWEDSPEGWPRRFANKAGDQFRLDGRPTAQWARLRAGRSDDLG